GQHLLAERERVVQGGLLRRALRDVLPLSGGDGYADRVRGSDGDRESRKLRHGGRRGDRRGRLHRFSEPVRDVRPGRKRGGVERADRERRGPSWLPATRCPGRALGWFLWRP